MKTVQSTPRMARIVVLIVALAVVAALIMIPGKLRPTTADDGGPPDTIELTGIIRDFHRTHVDFEAVPAGGYGHYAGNLQAWLPGTKRPVHIGTGYRVDEEWRDREGRPIAPHMASVHGGAGGGGERLGLRVNEKIEVKYESRIDAFNSNYGPYGLHGNYGSNAVVTTNSTDHHAVKIDSKSVVRGRVLVGPGDAPSDVIDNKGVITGGQGIQDAAYEMPVIALPDDLQEFEEHVDLEGEVTLTGDTDPDDDTDVPALHFGKLHVKKDAIVLIEGDLRILCEQELKVEEAEIVLLPEARLTIYANDGAKVELKHGTLVNTEPGDTSAVSINAVGEGYLKIEKDSHVYATIVAPQRKLEVKEAHFYGAFVGEALKLEKKTAGIHIDEANAVAGKGNFALRLREKVEIEDFSAIDGFDSNLGPYSEANSGADALVTTNETKHDKVKIKKHSTVTGDFLVGPLSNPHSVIKIEDHSEITGTMGTLAVPAPIPVVAPPALGESVGEIKYDGGTHTITGSLRCKKLKLEHKATLEIAGDVVIRCDDKLEMKDRSEIVLLPGASLTLYVEKEVKLDDRCQLNMNTGNPQLVSIRRTSVGKKGKVEIKKNSALCAWVQGAQTEMKVEDHSEFYGSFAGRKIKVKDHSFVHVDMAYLSFCLDLADTAGLAGGEGAAAVESPETFDQWYRDVLGVNQSMVHSLILTRGGDGVYEYLSDDFHPIDDRLFGNEGQAHNHHFTYAIHADFVYAECGGQFVEFEGGDGAWLYVDGRLAMDLDGVKSGTRQFVDLDRLGLEGGSAYQANFYFAQRNPQESVFRLRTNIGFSTEHSAPPVTEQYD